jgi:ribosome-associated protein
MFRVTGKIALEEREIRERFVRSSGPGGQNVNKVATAVRLRFDVRGSPSLPDDVRERLIRIAGNRLNREGVLIIEAGRYRTQERNRRDARERLAEWIRRAAVPPRRREKTRPSRESEARRLGEKHRRGEVKRARRPVLPPEP